MGKVFCILGIDGSGKTTQAMNIVHILKKDNPKFIYKWGKFESTLLRYIIIIKNKFLKIEGDSINQYHSSKDLRKNIFSKKYFRYTYLLFVLFSYYLQILFKFKIPLMFGYNVVSDRYYFDTAVDLAFEFSYDKNDFIIIINLLKKLGPFPSKIIYLKVPCSVAIARKKDIPDVDFLIKKTFYYEILLELFNIHIVDGTKDKREIQIEIKNYLFNRRDRND